MSDHAGALLARTLLLPSSEEPFPWQRELLRRLLQGVAVEALDLPTGLGKTSVMAIWLAARALGAKLPRRLVYVVDRRAVVDQATRVAEGLRALVEGDSELREALGLDRALPISTLRGQHVDNKEWLEDPALPAIVVGTVDMVGSRLLFEGYATSRKMRPYHAGLLGADTLLVLDEAHLVPPFERLVESIAADPTLGPTGDERRELVPLLRVMSLSATGRTGRDPTRTLSLGPDDMKNPVVKRRIHAKKTVSRRTLDDPKELALTLAKVAWDLADQGARPTRIIVFCDRRTDAVAVRAQLLKLGAAEGNVALFVGGRRVLERELLAEWLEARGFVATSKAKEVPDGPTFVVATSAGEVGVDLDAEHMVCDLVAWERMVQRLGRVNRRGDGDAQVVVVELDAPPDKDLTAALAKGPAERKDKEVTLVAAHEARVACGRALAALLRRSADASPAALLALREDEDVRRILTEATTPPPLRPGVTRALVDAWSMTSLRDHTGRPEVGPWLRGWIEGEDPQTTVVWRAHLPLSVDDAHASADEFFEAAPPHLSERLELETDQVLAWLEGRLKETPKAKGATPAEGDEVSDPPLASTAFVRPGDDGSFERVDLRDVLQKETRADLRRKLIGATLVVHATLAGLTDGLLDPEQDTVPVVADDASGAWTKTAEGVPVVRFKVVPTRAPSDDDPPPERDGGWVERYRFVTRTRGDEPTAWLTVFKWRDDAETEDDRGTAAKEQRLDEHQSWVEGRARRIGERLRLPREWSEALAQAGRLHDEGKKARRWQLAFNAKSDGPYAKTCGPIRFKLLGGYRHELGSLPHAERDGRLAALSPEQRDLALHLIAAHHGFARPLISPEGCDDGPPSVIEERVRQVALRFLRLQKQWGPWGLAWWEALLRAADQQASRDLGAPEGEKPRRAR